jgi:hypothetical protein
MQKAGSQRIPGLFRRPGTEYVDFLPDRTIISSNVLDGAIDHIQLTPAKTALRTMTEGNTLKTDADDLIQAA